MLDMPNINAIVEQVAKSALGPNVARVTSEPWVDWIGRDALYVMVVLDDGTVGQVTGEKVGDFLLRLNDTLQERGEDRRPFIRYATVSDLAERQDAHA